MIKLYLKLFDNCKTINQFNQFFIPLENRMTPCELFLLKEELDKHYFKHVPSIFRNLLHDILIQFEQDNNNAFNRTLNKETRRKKKDAELGDSIVSAQNSKSLRTNSYNRDNTTLVSGLVVSAFKLLKPGSTALKYKGYLAVCKTYNRAIRGNNGIPKPFIRKNIAQNIKLFTTPSNNNINKTLIIGFTGNFFRLMMPISIFLQNIDADKYDLLLLSDKSRKGYNNGLPGVANNITELIEYIGALSFIKDYDNVVSFGTSGGGFASLYCALKLRLNKGISIGGGYSTRYDPDKYTKDKAVITLKKLSQQFPNNNLLYIFGSDCENDRKKAEFLTEHLPINTLEVISSAGNTVSHVVTAPILTEGRLSTFFNKVFSLEPVTVPVSHYTIK